MGYLSDAPVQQSVQARTDALDSVVFGVDIQSGDIRGSAPSFALVVINGESIDRDVVSYRKLRRRIERDEPTLIATDNAYELASDSDALVGFLRSLPDGTRLVQVTGAERPEPLSRVANRYDVPYGSDPMQEAEAAARLAAQNVGYVVSAFTNTTEVKIARGRSPGSGGFSEDRYTRRIHGAVKRRSREVESELDDAGLEYDREVTEKYGGFSQALFTVSATPEEIPVSAARSGDVRVEINREQRDGIEFQSLAERRDHVIVGIDPGTTTAAAVVGLDGSVLDVLSTRTADTSEITEWLIDRGQPLLVAADVTPMPETVEQFRRTFDAAGWTPPSDIPVDEKKHRAPDHAFENDHERDAVAAAVSAYDDHADQFERITRKVPPKFDRGEVIARVLAEELSVEAVLRDLEEEDTEEDASVEHEPRELTEEEQRIRDLERQVDRLQSHVEELEATIEEKDARIEELEAELSTARREERREARKRQEVTRLRRRAQALERDLEREEERNEELEDKLKRLKALWRLDHSNFSDVAEEKQGLVPVKPIDEFTKTAIHEADEQYGLAADDVIYLRDASGAGRSTAELLVDVNPRVVLRDGGQLSEVADRVLFEADIPVGPAEEVAMQEVDELAVARESDVEAVIEDWEDRAEERKREQTAEMVDQLISEYRVQERGS